MSKLCIYHGNCADGFAAAWAMRQAHPDTEFHAGVYQNFPPPTAGRDVYLLDFSYKAPVLEEIAQGARSVTVLDHHKSAIEDLAQLVARGLIGGVFDTERSGAMIAWNYFHPDEVPPELIAHIEDRDLWRFELPGTREIQAAVFSYPYDFAVWDELMVRDTAELYAEGIAIERKHHKDVAELVAVCRRRMRIAGFDVPAASLPYTMVSDAAHLMAKGELFAACYWDTPAGRVFGLRSTEGGMDVSEVAKVYGGGGHKHAAGFRVPYDVAARMEIPSEGVYGSTAGAQQ